MHESPSEHDESWDQVAAKIESELAETTQILQDMQARFNAVKTAMGEQEPLTQEYHQRLETLAQTPEGISREALIHDLAIVQERLAAIRVTLESQLFSVRDLGPIFWQVARFVGLGIVIGAILRGFVP
ncbi:MAG: hypothetical protein WCO45_08490 [Pseudanabaena sp. ELA607]|jgi:hypothetical protein